MKNSVLYILWAVLFALCGALGFLPEPEGSEKVLCLLLSVAFFLPPAVLVYRGDRRDIQIIRNLSALALLTAAVLLVLNILSASFSQMAGLILHCILVVATSPMVCSRYWALILFLWAYLMLHCHKKLKEK